ncbi:MAG: 50S ribosomal protein L9 [Gammaproteobacteria bacterium]|nr:50S ribosomal protein L9 [Gammaproteobacteria bacterium]
MEIILLDRVENLGDIGDTVKVKPGYARNYLLPQGKAATATPENLKKLEARRSELEREAAEDLAAAKARAGTIENLRLEISAKAGTEGKLFGSVGTVDIAEAAKARGIEIERSEIRMPDGPIRVAGDHDVDIHLHSDITVPVVVVVVGEE